MAENALPFKHRFVVQRSKRVLSKESVFKLVPFETVQALRKLKPALINR